MSNPNRAERGQIIVVVALALTIIVAMVGVVIDGGLAWTNRRQVQNAADSAALAGTRVLGLDVRWRASGSPNPPGAPFANADAAVCAAINNALSYNTNPGQVIPSIACAAGSPDAVYVDYDGKTRGMVGKGIPLDAQGVRVNATGRSSTVLMSVVGISTIDVVGDATALAGPAEPPLGKLMPFVVQNPLQPFVPGSPYEVRSESEGECGTAELDSLHLAMDSAENGIVLASAMDPLQEPPTILSAKPLTPVADPAPQTFTASVTVTLSSPTSGAKIHYTTDGSTPTAASPEYKNNTNLTFTATTVLKAISIKLGESSEVGTFTYTKAEPPPNAVTATPGSQTFSAPLSVSLTTTTSGATIYYTTNGSAPTTSSSVYTAPIPVAVSTVINAMAYKNLSSSPVSTFAYTLTGDTAPPTASPPSGTEFESGLSVQLSTTTSGATIYYTKDGSTPTTSSPTYSGSIVLTGTTTIKAFASANGKNSFVSTFTYTKTGPSCPDLTAGNFGWVDFSGGAGGNNELKGWVDDPSSAPGDWYYRNCSAPNEANCRDQHGVADAADDHWRLEGTTGHRQVTMEIACKYVGQEIYVPIWDGFETVSKKPNGSNAVFHLIGFAAFRLDGIIDTKNNGDPSGKGCGVQDIDGVSRPNEKGFIGTYVDSFIGTQVARCIIDPVTSNPCSNLSSNTAFTINLSE